MIGSELTDAAMEAVFQNRPNLQQYDTNVGMMENGVMRGTVLQRLADEPEMCPHFRKILLDGYSTCGSKLPKILKALSTSRKGPHIETSDIDRQQRSDWKDGVETVEHWAESEDEGQKDWDDRSFDEDVARRPADSGSECGHPLDQVLKDQYEKEHIPYRTETLLGDDNPRIQEIDSDADGLDPRAVVSISPKEEDIVDNDKNPRDEKVDSDADDFDARAMNAAEGEASTNKKKRKTKKKKLAIWSIRPDNSPEAVTFVFAIRVRQDKLVAGIEQVKFDGFPVTE